jgi:hypothetical protein
MSKRDDLDRRSNKVQIFREIQARPKNHSVEILEKSIPLERISPMKENPQLNTKTKSAFKLKIPVGYVHTPPTLIPSHNAELKRNKMSDMSIVNQNQVRFSYVL